MELRIENMEMLTSHGNIKGRNAMVAILEAGLEASDPYYNTLKLIRIENGKLIVGKKEYEPAGSPKTGDEVYDLSMIKNIWVFGAGKGIQRVAKAIEDALGDRLTGGHVVDKKGNPIICQKIGVTLGAHPAPDADCVQGCQKIYEMITKRVGKDDLVFTCVANGVSSLMTLPVPGLSIDDVSKVTYVMQIKRGVGTGDLNRIRNHIDMLKCGRISRLMQPAKAVHILAIDPGDYNRLMTRNAWLHSLPGSSTFQMALDVIKKHDAMDDIPPAVREFLEAADPKCEVVRGEEFQKWESRIFGVMPGYGQTAKLPAAIRKAEELGFKTTVLCEGLSGIEARHAGTYLASICNTIERTGRPFEPPCAIFTSGEMIVTVGNENGMGGRNQECALSAALRIAGSKNIIISSVDTDGTDGPGLQFGQKAPEGMPSCLDGGIVDGETIAEAEKAGINIPEELKKHNTSVPLWKLGSGVVATPNISLNDLTVALVMGRSD
ncbi:MAG: DUF4147 domain-containing protein [Chloroflexota bacterium]